MGQLEGRAPEDLPSISVVICVYSWERWELLLEAVASVEAQTSKAYEIILVVDHNPSLHEALTKRLPSVRVVASSGQKGLSGARNSGILAAHGDVVAFLDDDAKALPGWIRGLADRYLDPRTTGVGGAALPNWVTEPPSWLPDEFLWVVGCSYLGQPTEAAAVRNFIGANMSFRRSTFDRVGVFTESLGRIGTLPAGCEETEFCIRVRLTIPDAVLVYDPALQVLHSVPPSRSTWTYFSRRCWAEGMSKAAVARLVGSEQALDTERGYVWSIFTTGLIAAARHRGVGIVGRLGRVAALLTGVGLAGLGYTYQQCRLRLPRAAEAGAGGRPAGGDGVE